MNKVKLITDIRNSESFKRGNINAILVKINKHDLDPDESFFDALVENAINGGLKNKKLQLGKFASLLEYNLSDKVIKLIRNEFMKYGDIDDIVRFLGLIIDEEFLSEKEINFLARRVQSNKNYIGDMLRIIELDIYNKLDSYVMNSFIITFNKRIDLSESDIYYLFNLIDVYFSLKSKDFYYFSILSVIAKNEELAESFSIEILEKMSRKLSTEELSKIIRLWKVNERYDLLGRLIFDYGIDSQIRYFVNKLAFLFDYSVDCDCPR